VRTAWSLLVVASCCLPAPCPATAQAPPAFEAPATNPRAVVRQRVAATDIEISYNRPRVRGRRIFGALVPFGQVWRTGADAATRISFSTPVSLGGARFEAGQYELFTIPGERDWVVILQPRRDQWGSYGYDAARDAGRVTVRAQRTAEMVESFTISVDDVQPATAMLRLAWDRTRVDVPVGIDVRETVVPRLEEALRAEGRRPYFQAAMFYYEHDLDLERAELLMMRALEPDTTHIGMLYRLALIRERRGDRAGAIQAAQRSLAGAATAAPELRAEYTRLNEVLLERLGR
jgi:hypothetical protein